MTRVTGTPQTPAEHRANASYDLTVALGICRDIDAARNRGLPTVLTQKIEHAQKCLNAADAIEAEVAR